jgi:hypothetical protein
MVHLVLAHIMLFNPHSLQKTEAQSGYTASRWGSWDSHPGGLASAHTHFIPGHTMGKLHVSVQGSVWACLLQVGMCGCKGVSRCGGSHEDVSTDTHACVGWVPSGDLSTHALGWRWECGKMVRQV